MFEQRAGYLRLSSEDGNDESLSIANQRNIISQYAKEHGYEISQFYIDDGYSGYKFDRPAFNRLRQDIADGLVEGIIVKDLSRLGRHNAKVQLFIEEMTLMQKELISIGDDFNNLTDDDAMIGIKSWFNERLVKDTSKKIRDVIYSKQKDGQWICNIPYGYRKIYNKKNAFEIDPVTSLNVKRMFDLYINGHGTYAIAKIFNSEGIPTPNQVKEQLRIEAGLEPTNRITAPLWSDIVIRRMINNEFYIGTLVQRKEKTVGIHGKKVKRDEDENIIFENHHEPIIDKETFYLAQKIRSERAAKHHKGIRKHFNLFTGMVFCADCGKPMTPRSGVHKHRYYVCSTYNVHGSQFCNHNRVYEQELIEFVKIYLKQCRQGLSDAIENLDQVIQEELKKVCDTQSISSMEALQKELNKATAELRGLMEQKVRDIIGNPGIKDILEETYQKAINDKSNYIQNLKIQLDEQQEACKSTKEAKDGLNRALMLFDEIITSDTLTVKQLKLLVEKIEVKYNGGIDVYMNGNLNEVMCSHVELCLGSIDIYKKAVVDTLFESKEFFLQDIHKAVMAKGYPGSYYRTFMPVINSLESAGIIVRAPRYKDKNYVVGTKEDAYILFNLYTEEYVGGRRSIADVTFGGLLKICKWVKHLSQKKKAA